MSVLWLRKGFMTKPKAQKQKDRMARLNNKIVALVTESGLDATEAYMVMENIRYSLLHDFRKATGQE